MRDSLAALWLLVLTVGSVAAAQAPSEIEQTPRSAPVIEGTWSIRPLVPKGAPAPGTSGQFQEFGETYVLENAVVFWARFGPEEKDWGLFSFKQGIVSKILLHDVDFIAPDGRKVKVRRTGPPPALLHVGNRILYISHFLPDHVYGWDGDRLARVLGAGDHLMVGGVRYSVKKASVLDVSSDGRALLYYDASEPQHINGWVVYDGASFTPLWKEGDPLPGMVGVQIKNLSAGRFCDVNCVAAPRLLEDGSILAVIEVTGTPYKTALFRIARGKTEKILAEKTQEPGSPYIGRLGDLLAARSDSFVMDVSESGVYFKYDVFVVYMVYYMQPRLLFYHQGKFRLESIVGARELGGGNVGFAFDHAMFLGPDSPLLLVTVKSSRKKVRPGLLKNKRTDISFPLLSFWDGEQLSWVQWETALGMDFATASKALETKPQHYWSPLQAKVIGLRRISKPVSGVGVLLPTGGTASALWFVGADSTDGKLERPPRFKVAGRTVTVADVIAWRGSEEALVELEDGLYALTKMVQSN